MNVEQINDRVKAAIEKLAKQDLYLLEKNASERCVTHRLAVYLESEFTGRSVDCEYNLGAKGIKTLMVLRTRKKDLVTPKRVSVYPDIVIHRRGQDGPNDLIIEIKKHNASSRESEFDRVKIEGYVAELGYKRGLLLTLPGGTVGKRTFGLAWYGADLGPPEVESLTVEA